jgi:tRNA1Val (adenine37-N6)-methyltransferase
MFSLDGLRDIKVYQNRDGYRFSVDALLLYCFVTLHRAERIADLGAGSGIIGLLLARKYPEAQVLLVELQESLAALAAKSITLNGLDDRVRVMTADVKEVGSRLSAIHRLVSMTGVPQQGDNANQCGNMPDSFDLIVSNPPFRQTGTGRLSNGDEKAIARHEVMLSLEDLAAASSLMLKHHGRFCIIHLPERLADICAVMRAHALEPKRLRFVHSSSSSEAKMLLVEAVKGARPGLRTERPLVLYNEDGSYTQEVRECYVDR